jgi:ribosomal protein S18 acetylase RimI-like enzyme
VGPTSGYTIRPITPADEPFLWEALYHAIYLAPGDTPPERDIVNRPELARYARGWDDVNDIGFVAVSQEIQQPIGAAWIRLLTSDNRGYGYIDDATPELSIAVLPEYRGQGVGTGLLTHLLQAVSIHRRSVSLSVEAGNLASRLYRRLGFEIVRTSGTSLIMRKTFV